MNILIKLFLNGIVLVPLLSWFTDASLFSIVVNALILSILAYFLGDQGILRASNNTVATIADGLLAFVYLWAVSFFNDWDLSFAELAVTVLALAVVEAVFHYMIVRDKIRI